jgi:hypothetical protein
MGNSTKVLGIKKKAIALKQQIRNLVPIAKSMKPGAEIANKKMLMSRATLNNLIKQLQQLNVDSSEINKLKEETENTNLSEDRKAGKYKKGEMIIMGQWPNPDKWVSEYVLPNVDKKGVRIYADGPSFKIEKL